MALFSRSGSSAPLDWSQRFRELAARSRHEPLRAFYRHGAVAADTPLVDTPLAALDLETTGLDPKRHAIVSIGLVPFSLERIHTPRSWYRVVRPRRELESRSVTIHHITHDELSDAPDIADVAGELLDALAGRVAVVHFHAIERRFLYQAFERRFGEGVTFPLIDTLWFEKRLRQRRTANPLTWFGRRRVSLRLADTRRRYHLPEYGAHHALTDALATAELFQAQVAHHADADDPVGEFWL